MGGRAVFLFSVAFAAGLVAADGYTSTQRKLDQIEAGNLKPGTRVVLTEQEITEWAVHEVPEGVRNPKVQIGTGKATGSALVDFGKLRRAQGNPPGWLMSRIIDGERPLSVTVRLKSSKGMATAEVERVEISGLLIEGQMLDFLIQNFLLAMYPDAAVSRRFEIGSRVDRIELTPGTATVVIGN